MSQPNETVVQPTIITFNKPVRLHGKAGVMLGYDNKFQYYKDDQLQHKNALAFEYLSVKQNINTGTIRLSGSILQLPEEYSEIVCLPQSPYQKGGQS